MSSARSKRKGRAPLKQLTKNEANKTNRKRKARSNTKHKSKAAKSHIIDSDDSSKRQEDEFDVDLIKEPPKKKRKTNKRSILSPMPLSNPKHTINTNRQQNRNDKERKNDESNACTTSTSNNRSIYPRGKLSNISNQRTMPTQTSETVLKLQSTNNELTAQIIKYRANCKLYEKKCKSLKHGNETFKKVTNLLHERDKKYKRQRQKNQDKISELEVENELLQTELNKHLQAENGNDRSDDNEKINNLNATINEIEYECSRWKAKYNKLLEQQNKVFIEYLMIFYLFLYCVKLIQFKFTH